MTTSQSDDDIGTFGEVGSPETNKITVRLGRRFQCPCGCVMGLSGAWLAAHWDDVLKRKCDNPNCCQKFSLKSGVIKLRGEPYGN